ncbi:probable leucine-rich repeat receptor-like protein kinase At5g49770, partial [Neltuma alba]|uniref:probable leucine-rich repeat receptor-like protein kinase At5g49770 n=1 Tax=Neltuma alba TaxID=207710 RepID=UPI0010A4DC72
MDQRNSVLLLLLLLFQVLFVATQNSNRDFTALSSLTEFWENKPPSWVGTDPCGGWEGIECNNSRVASIKLLSMNLKGRLTEAIGRLTELTTLDLSYNKGMGGRIPAEIGNLSKLQILSLVGCDFSGPIPESLGDLKRLTFLALNLNRLSGNIPRTLGNLSNVNWLDIADNQIEGPIPISDEEGPGLDMLLKAEHFHFGNNRLSGEVQAKLLSSKMILKHLLLDNNHLVGSIPDTTGLIKTLTVVRYDHNQMTGEVPSSIKNLTKLTDLNLGNNKLNGSMPDLTGLDALASVDLSNNSFNPSNIPSWASSLPYLTTLLLESTGLQGEIPDSLFSQSNLETVILRNNKLNGTLDVGNSLPNLNLIDLQDNRIGDFEQKSGGTSFNVVLVGNPIFLKQELLRKVTAKARKLYHNIQHQKITVYLLFGFKHGFQPKLQCAFPYRGVLTSRAPGFSNFRNTSYFKDLEHGLLTTFQSHDLPVDSVSLTNAFQNSVTSYFSLDVEVFPSQIDRFNRTGVLSIS